MKPALRAYVANLDTIDPDAVIGAEVEGGTVSKAPNGKGAVVTLDNGLQITWKEAVKQGFVSIRGDGQRRHSAGGRPVSRSWR